MAKRAAQKRRRRRQAHNWIDGAIRTPSGQLSRSKDAKRHHRSLKAEQEAMTQREAQSVVVEARMRHLGVTEQEARHYLAGTVIGQLYMRYIRGEKVVCINKDQYEAADWFIQRRNEYQQSILSPDAYWERQEGGGNRDEEVYEAFVSKARENWRSIMNTLQECQTEQRTPVIEAVNQFINKDNFIGHLLGDLRTALNALSNLQKGA